MAFRLDRIPLIGADREISLGGVSVMLRLYQPVVWVRLVPWVGPRHSEAVTFPAVIDTGNNHSFLIPASLFEAWVRLDPETLMTRHKVRVNDRELSCHGLNIDVYRMRRGDAIDRIAGRLQTDRGVVIVKRTVEHQFPRLPVIGVRSLCASRASFALSGDLETFSLRGPG